MYYIGNQQNKTQELLSCSEYCSTQNSSDATGVCHNAPVPYPCVAIIAPWAVLLTTLPQSSV